jgi:hypothetical protein
MKDTLREIGAGELVLVSGGQQSTLVRAIAPRSGTNGCFRLVPAVSNNGSVVGFAAGYGGLVGGLGDGGPCGPDPDPFGNGTPWGL